MKTPGTPHPRLSVLTCLSLDQPSSHSIWWTNFCKVIACNIWRKIALTLHTGQSQLKTIMKWTVIFEVIICTLQSGPYPIALLWLTILFNIYYYYHYQLISRGGFCSRDHLAFLSHFTKPINCRRVTSSKSWWSLMKIFFSLIIQIYYCLTIVQ